MLALPYDHIKILGSFADCIHADSIFYLPVQQLNHAPVTDETTPCLRALLRAGADPTLSVFPWGTSGFSLFLPYSSDTDVSFLALLATASAHTAKQFIHCILEEGSAYMDFSYKNDRGRGYWLDACHVLAQFKRPEILYQYIRAGADIAEVDRYGFNCLFVFMSNANRPRTVEEMRALSFLLTIFDDIYAHDARGNDVFAYVNEVKEWPRKDNVLKLDAFGSYRQDLWYCALARSGLDVRYGIQSCNRLARYTVHYTPRHYQALCYLDD